MIKNKKISYSSLCNCFVAIIIFSMIFLSTIFRGNNIIYIITIEILIVFIFRFYKNLNKSIIILFFYITIFYIASNLSTLNSRMTLYFYLTFIFFTTNFLLFYGYLNKDSNNLIKILKMVSVFGNMVMMYSLYEASIKYNPVFSTFFPEPYKSQYSEVALSFYRTNGSVGQPVPFSSLVIFLICVNFALYKINNKKRYLFFTIISVLSLILTYTRNSYIAIILSSFFIFIISLIKERKIKKNKLIKVILALIVSIVILLIMILNKNEFLFSIINRFTNFKSEISFTQRTAGIEFVIRSLMVSPFRLLFGFGIGSLLNIRSYYDIKFYINNFYALDNQYFTLLFEFGLVGCAIILSYLLRVFKVIRKNNNKIINIFNTLLLSLLITQFFYDATYWIISIFILSITISIVKYLNDLEGREIC